jgi:hypothetical protein
MRRDAAGSDSQSRRTIYGPLFGDVSVVSSAASNTGSITFTFSTDGAHLFHAADMRDIRLPDMHSMSSIKCHRLLERGCNFCTSLESVTRC